MKLFCNHLDLPKNRQYGTCGYVYQCPKCQSYIGYSKEWDSYFLLTKKDYYEYIDLFCMKVGDDNEE